MDEATDTWTFLWPLEQILDYYSRLGTITDMGFSTALRGVAGTVMLASCGISLETSTSRNKPPRAASDASASSVIKRGK
jgi:hypothetical protein